MKTTLKEIIDFYYPDSVHTSFWDDDIGDYISGFTYFSENHPMYQFAKKRKCTLENLLGEYGEVFPHKLEIVGNMMYVSFDMFVHFD